MTKIKHIMSKDLVTIGMEKMVDKAVEAMNENDVDSVIIVDAGKPVGIFTTTDLRKRVVGEGLILENTNVFEVSTKNIRTLKHEEDAYKARQMMSQDQLNHILIVDDSGALVGVLSSTDLID